MAITNLSTSSLVSGVKRRRVWDQLATTDGFFQIATTTLNVAASSITFSSIPQDYTHLQIRGISRDARAVTINSINIRFNSDSGLNYSLHALNGNGSSATSFAETSQSLAYIASSAGASAGANIFSATVADILDYANTNKFKTLRSLTGVDLNGSGETKLWSGNWRSTSAITSISLTPNGSANFAQYSSFALYGLKG
jgi:hypothetical protein